MVHLAMVRLGFHLSVLADTFLRGDPVIEEGRISPHKGDGELLEESGHLNRLFLPCMSRFCAGQLGHFLDGQGVPGAKGLHGNRQENGSLPVAGQGSQDLSSLRF